MTTIINTTNLSAYWVPGEVWGHSIALAPMLAVHAAYLTERSKGQVPKGFSFWEWENPRAAKECLEASWNMTGKWQARRKAPVPRSSFDDLVPVVVARLAATLNRNRVFCLRDLDVLPPARYHRVVSKVHEAVADISKLRNTNDIEPVLGSKVLHHFFPSIVPVFDRRFIREGVLRTEAYSHFVQQDTDGWLIYGTSHEAGGPRLLDFHRYFAFGAHAVGIAPPPVLKAVRKTFARGFSPLAPTLYANDQESLLWTLDAKIAEYCMIGQAHLDGLIEGGGRSEKTGW